jgi:hypothetical protein
VPTCPCSHKKNSDESKENEQKERRKENISKEKKTNQDKIEFC